MKNTLFAKWLLVCVLLISFTHAKAENANILIGYVGPLSGLSAASGVSLLRAAQLAVQDHNESAVFLKTKAPRFELLPFDDKSNPYFAINAAKYLAATQVIGVVGLYNSVAVLASSPIYQQASLPHFSVIGPRSFTQNAFDSAFRIAPNDMQRSMALVSYVRRIKGGQRAMLIHDPTEFGLSYKRAYQAAIKSEQGESPLVVEISGNTYDFNDVIRKIKRNRPDVIFFASQSKQAVFLAEQLRRTGVRNVTLVLTSSIAPDSLKAAANDDIEIVVMTPALISGNERRLADFNQRYEKLYHAPPEPFAAATYDATQMLMAAYERAGGADRKKIIEVLHQLRYAGISGTLAFNSEGDLRSVGIELHRLRRNAIESSMTLRLDNKVN